MKKMLITTTVLAALVANAQAADIKKDGEWRGAAGLALSLASGNTQSKSFVANANVASITDMTKWAIYGNSISGSTTSGNTTVSKVQWLLGTKYDYNLTPDYFAFGLANLEGDKGKNLNMRATLGAGLGYHVIKTAQTTFDVFAGLAQTHDKYRNPQLINNSLTSSRNMTEALLGEESNHVLSETVSLTQKLVVYPNLSSDGGYRAAFDAGVAVALNKTMNLNVGIIDRYSSLVAPGIKKNDIALFTGVSIKLGKD